MYEIKLKFLPVMMTAASVVVAAETTDVRGTINRVDVGRQEIAERGGAYVKGGNKLFVDGRYEEAIAKYREARKIYERYALYGGFKERDQFCENRIKECYYLWAKQKMNEADDLAQVRDYDAAISACKTALEFCEQEQKDELARMIEIYEKRRDNAVERDAAKAEQLVPNLKAQEYQIQVLMEQGRKLAMNREYGRAARKFQEVLLINPFNADALQCLRAVHDRIGSIGVRRHHNEHRKMMGEVEWKSATPYQPFSESSAQNLLDSGSVKVKPESKGSELFKRLNEIKFSRFATSGHTVAEVVEDIRMASIKYDPEKRGVNIVFLRSIPKKEQTQNENQNPDNAGEDNPDQPRNQGNDQQQGTEDTITLDLMDVSIIQTLDHLCNKTTSPKMCYQVDENAVLIFPANYDLGGMLTEVVHINLEEGTTDEQLKGDMIANGIEFRKGSGAGVTYNAKLGRVTIKNDSKNLDKMKAFLERRKTNDGAMIQLQIKLIEMNQKDIDELAFNWQYAVNTNQSYYTGGANSSTPLSSPANRTLSRATIMQSSSNELLRYYMPDSNHSTTMYQDSTYAFVWANSDGTKINANLFALDWADSMDVLASPRVTTIPGHKAKIQMVTIRYFPEDWETIETDTKGSPGGISVSRVTPQPTLDKEKTLGPQFEITPTIITRGEEKLIKLHLRFPIETFSDEWIIYDNTQNGGDDDGDYIQMPVFNKREIDCDMILGDGETIVLGGVGKDDTTTVNDKIPILGDIPIIGRLFQSKYSNASKNNLLIFLTGRLVKPDGSAYNPAKQIQRGLPGFGRLE